MTFYGARSSLYYLEKLRQASRLSVPYDLVSVIGGMAFIHAVGHSCQSITLIDRDADGVNYCKFVLEAIKTSSTLDEFGSKLHKEHQRLGVDDSVVLSGHGLLPGKFYWHFGYGALTNDKSFERLRWAILQADIWVGTGELVEHDYGRNFQHGRDLVVAASNTDSPLYSKNPGEILARISETTKNRTHYFTWLKSVTIELNVENHDYDNYLDV